MQDIIAIKVVLSILALTVAPLLLSSPWLSLKRRLEDVSGKYPELKSWQHYENMPRALRTATVFLNEEEVSTRLPVPLHGITDQVFKTGRDKLIVVDTKTREQFRVYTSDIIQLSVYGLILSVKHQGKFAVSPHGYVRVVVDAGGAKEQVRYIRVKLLPESEVVALWKKYQAIKKGEVAARCTCDGRYH